MANSAWHFFQNNVSQDIGILQCIDQKTILYNNLLFFFNLRRTGNSINRDWYSCYLKLQKSKLRIRNSSAFFLLIVKNSHCFLFIILFKPHGNLPIDITYRSLFQQRCLGRSFLETFSKPSVYENLWIYIYIFIFQHNGSLEDSSTCELSNNIK